MSGGSAPAPNFISKILPALDPVGNAITSWGGDPLNLYGNASTSAALFPSSGPNAKGYDPNGGLPTTLTPNGPTTPTMPQGWGFAQAPSQGGMFNNMAAQLAGPTFQYLGTPTASNTPATPANPANPASPASAPATPTSHPFVSPAIRQENMLGTSQPYINTPMMGQSNLPNFSSPWSSAGHIPTKFDSGLGDLTGIGQPVTPSGVAPTSYGSANSAHGLPAGPSFGGAPASSGLQNMWSAEGTALNGGMQLPTNPNGSLIIHQQPPGGIPAAGGSGKGGASHSTMPQNTGGGGTGFNALAKPGRPTGGQPINRNGYRTPGSVSLGSLPGFMTFNPPFTH